MYQGVKNALQVTLETKMCTNKKLYWGHTKTNYIPFLSEAESYRLNQPGVLFRVAPRLVKLKKGSVGSSKNNQPYSNLPLIPADLHMLNIRRNTFHVNNTKQSPLSLYRGEEKKLLPLGADKWLAIGNSKYNICLLSNWLPVWGMT